MTTVTKVLDLLGPNWLGNPVEAQRALEAVERMVAALDLDVTAAQRDDLERYLAAHFATLAQSEQSGGLQSWSIGDESRTWSGSDTALRGLQETSFGRAAVGLDTSGTLSEMSKPRPRFAVL